MMLSSLIRFPLIFISGIFVPLSGMSGGAAVIAYLSPLTYLVDGLNASMGQVSALVWAVDVLILLLSTVLFVFATKKVLRRNLMKGL